MLGLNQTWPGDQSIVTTFDEGMISIARDEEDVMRITVRKCPAGENLSAIIDEGCPLYMSNVRTRNNE
jgi:hypothetical protein